MVHLTYAARPRQRCSLQPPKGRGTPFGLPDQHQRVKKLLRGGPALQPKLKVGAPNDKYEQEADRMADQVMRMPAGGHSSLAGGLSQRRDVASPIQRTCATCSEEYKAAADDKRSVEPSNLCPKCRQEERGVAGGLLSQLVQRQEEFDDEDERLQTKSAGGQAAETTPVISDGVQSLQGRGRPLSKAERAFFEPRFGMDFSQVRIHDDAPSAHMARSINARAFTYGRDIVFGTGQYRPESREGKRLLGHELTHVIQQRNNGELRKKGVQRAPSGDGSGELDALAAAVPRRSQEEMSESELAAAGRSALSVLGYQRLMEIAEHQGLVSKVRRAQEGPDERSAAGGPSSGVIQREAFAAYATAAGIAAAADGPVPVGDIIALGILAVGLIAMATSSSRACPPCPSPPGPDIHRVPPSRPHFPCPGDHWHYFVYNQNPVTCQCYLQRRFGGCCGHPGAPC